MGVAACETLNWKLKPWTYECWRLPPGCACNLASTFGCDFVLNWMRNINPTDNERWFTGMSQWNLTHFSLLPWRRPRNVSKDVKLRESNSIMLWIVFIALRCALHGYCYINKNEIYVRSFVVPMQVALEILSHFFISVGLPHPRTVRIVWKWKSFLFYAFARRCGAPSTLYYLLDDGQMSTLIRSQFATESWFSFTLDKSVVTQLRACIVCRRKIDICDAPFSRLDSTFREFEGVVHRIAMNLGAAIWIAVSHRIDGRWQINVFANLFNVVFEAIAHRRLQWLSDVPNWTKRSAQAQKQYSNWW